MSSFSDFFKQIGRETKGSSTGSSQLDKAINFTSRASTLVNLEPYAGNTAICLQLAYGSILSGSKGVCFVSGFNFIYSNRLRDISDKLIVCNPDSVDNFLSIVTDFSGNGLTYILDSSYLLDGWNLASGMETIVSSVLNLDQSCTVICGSPKKYKNNFWTNVITGEVDKTRWVNGVKVGHTAKLSGPLGDTKIYVEYSSGRISRGYDLAMEQVDLVGKSGIYKYSELEIRGFWNFVDAIDSKISNNVLL